jgi:spore germination cell wall hydrolase CwlJ-like protein
MNEHGFWLTVARWCNVIVAAALVGMCTIQAAKGAERAEREIACLALNVYHEARGEPLIGQFAVAYVTLERANAKRRSVCRTVYEPGQFSWTAEKHGRAHGLAWRRAVHVAKTVWLHDVLGLEPPMRATHFHADYVSPAWRRSMQYIETIGRHRFYIAKVTQ